MLSTLAASTAQLGPGSGPWEIATPESQGLSTSELNAAAAASNNDMGGRVCYLVVKNGKLVHETYYRGTGISSTRAGWSTTKSMCASLYGVAKQQGFANTTLPLADTGVNKLNCNQASDFSNVLTMTGTSSNINNPRFSYDTLGNQCLDTLQDYIGRYNPEGLSIDEWKDRYWSDVLGLEHTRWSSGGLLSGLQCGFTAEPSCRDLARMAQLWTNEGAWAGHGQVMDKQFANDGREWVYPGSGTEYGYTLWLNVNDPVDRKVAEFNGMFGQCAYTSKEHNAVIVSMGQGNGCSPAWTNGRSAIVSNDHPKYATTRDAAKRSHSEIRNFQQQEAIQMSSVLALRDGVIKSHRHLHYDDLVYYNSRLVEFGGRSIFRRGATPNATNVHDIIVDA
jgi:hypothetical protein